MQDIPSEGSVIMAYEYGFRDSQLLNSYMSVQPRSLIDGTNWAIGLM